MRFAEPVGSERHLQIRIFPISFSGCHPIVLLRPFRQSLIGENGVAGAIGSCRPPNSFAPTRPIPKVAITGRQTVLPVLPQVNFCRQIEVIDVTAPDEAWRLACPTTHCLSNLEDWVYPNEIGQPTDKWGRRVIRVIDKNRERFVVCGKSHGYSRKRISQRFVVGSRTAA